MADDELSLPAAGLPRPRTSPLAASVAAADHAVAAYLAELRRELRHAPDLEDLMDEVADHLASAVARHEAGGASHGTAVQRALASFGHSADVGEGFRERGAGSAGVPTPQTRLAGLALRVAALALPLVVLTFWASDAVERATGSWEGGAQSVYMIGAIFLLVGNGLGMWGGLGLLSRHGGLRDWRGVVAVVLLGIGVLASVVAWALVAWTAALAIAWLAVVLAIGRRMTLPRSTVRLLQSGYLLAFVGSMGAAILTNGEDSTWQLAGAAPGLLLVATGFFLAGSTLAREVPVGGGTPPATTA